MTNFSPEDFLNFSDAAYLGDPPSEIGGLTYQKDLVDNKLTESADTLPTGLASRPVTALR